MENLGILVRELLKNPTETTWLEFKHNNYDFDTIGMDISALANSAVLSEREKSYMIWGIEDKTHEIVGTDYDQYTLKKGNEEIDNWLRQHLSKNANFEFHSLMIDDKKVVVLIIHRAVNQPVMFKKTDYVRVGSYTKKLNEQPAIQTQLWDKLRTTRYEELDAKKDLSAEEVVKLLDCTAYFDLKHEPQPTDLEGVLHYLTEERIIKKQDSGLYCISNLGAILFANRLDDFPNIARKAIRIVQYKGDSRFEIKREETGKKGYAVEFNEVMNSIGALLPTREIFEGAVRRVTPVYPSLAIREIIANALIHQDFSITGTGPVVEIFDSRVEVTNPGTPLVEIMRIVDNPPRSRNEMLARLMRRLGMCEELGTGWDKIVNSCELYQLPAPRISTYEDSTRMTLLATIPFSNMTKEDKLWACYLHACVKQVSGEVLTNSSLRKRFGLNDSSAISKLIRDAVKKNLIKPLDPQTAPRYMKYIPCWA